MTSFAPLLSSSYTPICVLLLFAFFAHRLYIPDSYEYALFWECLGNEAPQCADILLSFRPPLMGLAIAPFRMFMPSILAVAVLSILCGIWAFQPLALLLKRQHVRVMWCATLSILLCFPLLQLFAIFQL